LTEPTCAAPGALPAASLLQLMWLASPALPIGGFSYSEGLEAGVEWAGLADEATASDWIVDQLHLSLARGDLPVVAQAIAAWRAGGAVGRARIAALNAWALQTRESAEFVLQTEQMGRSFVEWLKLHHDDVADAFDGLASTITYPVAFAFAAARTQADVRDCCLAFAFGWAENMVGAAVKSVPLGQSSGQRMLGRLAAEIPAAVDRAMACGDDERQAFAPMLAIHSARHETQYSRLFRS
jgi:urease accessory protein